MKSLYLKILRLLVVKNLNPNLKPLVAFVFIWLTIVGCEPRISVINKNSRYFSKFPKEQTVVFNNISEYKKGIAGTLTLVDSTLTILNVLPGAKKFLTNYSFNSGKYSKEYLRKGSGPGEAMGPISIGVNDNSLWVQDIILKKIFTIDKRKVINTITPKTASVTVNSTKLNPRFLLSFLIFILWSPFFHVNCITF